MKKESLAKAKQTREANKDKFANQSIQLDGITLKRRDEYNWVVIRKGRELEPHYYGRLIHALRDIPHQMLQDVESIDLKTILSKMDRIEEEITRMFNMKFDNFEPVEGE